MYKIIGADGKEYGPVSIEQLRQWINEGRVNSQTSVRGEGGVDWRPLGTLPEFSLLFGVQTAPPTIGPRPGQHMLGQPQRVNPFATTGLIMGLVSITFGLCCCYGIPFNVLGIIFSLVALAQIKSSPHVHSGQGIAIAGLITSLLSFALVALFLMFGVALSWSDIMRDVRKF
jgi:hypothetical protein